jgi:cephalosporin-C deacetylase
MPKHIIKMASRFITVLLLFFMIVFGYAQPAEQFIKVVVAPDHADWTYKTGENVKFTITVLQNGNPIKNAVVKYETGPEKMDLQKKDSLSLREGTLVVDAGTMKEPGFLRCVPLPPL